jgi:hypothetical protein
MRCVKRRDLKKKQEGERYVNVIIKNFARFPSIFQTKYRHLFRQAVSAVGNLSQKAGAKDKSSYRMLICFLDEN